MTEQKKQDHHIAGDVGLGIPKKGDRFKCADCKMELQITADCNCSSPAHVHFHCCDKEMTKA